MRHRAAPGAAPRSSAPPRRSTPLSIWDKRLPAPDPACLTPQLIADFSDAAAVLVMAVLRVWLRAGAGVSSAETTFERGPRNEDDGSIGRDGSCAARFSAGGERPTAADDLLLQGAGRTCLSVRGSDR